MDLCKFQLIQQQPSPAGLNWLESWLAASYPGPAMDPHVSGKERPSRAQAPTTVVSLKYPASAALPCRPNATALPTNTCSALASPTPSRSPPSSQQPGDRRTTTTRDQAMELFPDGAFVRLQSRGNSKYVHADGDWEGVSLRPLGLGPVASLESVWRVQHLAVNLRGQGFIFLLLQNAAYGRYLSFSPFRAQLGHRGRRAVQSDRNEPPNHEQNAYLWWWGAERVDPNQDYVRLSYGDSHFFLRANGRYRTRNTGVTVAVNRRRHGLSTMMQWTVHVVPATPVQPPLPIAPPHQPLQIQGVRRGNPFWAFWRRTTYGPGMYEDVPRMIRHVRANDEGEFQPNHYHWLPFITHDVPVFNLTMYLGNLQDDWTGDMRDFMLCIRAGLDGRLMPLVTHLPRSTDDLCLVVLRTGSPAAEAFMYPQIFPPAP